MRGHRGHTEILYFPLNFVVNLKVLEKMKSNFEKKKREGSIQGIEDSYTHHLDCHYVEIIVDTLHRHCCNQVFLALFLL